MGSYSIVKKPEKLILTLEGRFEDDTVQKFVQDFMSEVKTIIPSQYILEVDAMDMNVISQDMQVSLKECFKMYQSVGFKKVTFRNKANAILSMQVNRIASEAGLENFEVV